MPPDVIGETLRWALTHHPKAVVTDVGSIKTGPLEQLRARGSAGLARYVGGHPMAGSERSGPLAASAALFDGRPWAVTPHQDSAPEAVALVLELVRLSGATPVQISPASTTAPSPAPPPAAPARQPRCGPPGRGPARSPGAVRTGVRDVTRVAAGDPDLWQQIVTGNAPAVVHLLGEVREQLDELIAAVSQGRRKELTAILEQGVAGTAAIPGKHGGPAKEMASVFVSVPDHPGELARLFADAGASGVNIEDVRIDHDPGRPTGLVELLVATDMEEHLLTSLESRGWVTHR